jgi:imidazolonepropionase-like amidohydrolase
LRAAVEAAENWGTDVTVHAYTPRAVRQGSKRESSASITGNCWRCHAQLMAEKGIWWSLQRLWTTTPIDLRPVRLIGSSNCRCLKGPIRLTTGTAFHIKTAWGTDVLFAPHSPLLQNERLVALMKWYSEAEACGW